MAGRNWERGALIVLLGAAGLWLGVRFVLPALAPFLIGLAVAAAAQGPVRMCRETLSMPRWAASFLCVGAIFAALGLGLWLLGALVTARLGAAAQSLPGMLRSASDGLAGLSDAICEKAPAGMEDAVRGWTESVTHLGERLSDAAIRAMGGAVTALPEAVLFAVTAVLSSFMLAVRLPELRQRIPLRFRRGAVQVKNALRLWLRAQLRLSAVTFAICTAGLLLLGLPHFLGAAALTAAVDALPVLGSGTVLLPWGALCLLRGQTRRGIGLAVLYAACALTRAALEPRLLGRHLGLSPLVTLAAMYTGFRLCGVPGMIFFPIGAMLLGQLRDLFRTAIQ